MATMSATNANASVESSSSAVNWGPIVAGAFAASTLTLILMLLGSGLGLTMVSPWSSEGASVTTFAVSTAIWVVIVQWLSSAVGGYLTGRLRTKWVGIHTDETFFRDTAHGFMAWALATLLVVLVLSSALSSVVGRGVQAASTVTSGVANTASAGTTATANARSDGASNATSYFVDALFRPTDPARLSAPGAEGDAAAAAQAARILIAVNRRQIYSASNFDPFTGVSTSSLDPVRCLISAPAGSHNGPPIKSRRPPPLRRPASATTPYALPPPPPAPARPRPPHTGTGACLSPFSILPRCVVPCLAPLR